MLNFVNVVKKYDDVTAVNHVSFQVGSGEVVGLIGANGAGKTTAIKLATGYLPMDSGEIWLNNINRSTRPMKDSGIAYIPDEPVYYDFMTVSEHLQFISAMYPDGEYSVEEIIAKFSLEEQLSKMPHMLSRGNKQKLLLATALLRKFDLLIADEPFNGLDPKQIHVLKNTLSELKSRNKGILISTHLLDIIELFCNRYVMIEKGCIIGQGSKTEIAEQFSLDKDLTIEQMYIQIADDKDRGLGRYEDNHKDNDSQ